MKMRLISPALGASLALVCAPAFGQTYFGVHVGGAFPPDQEIEGTFGEDTAPDFAALQGEAQFDPGFFGSVAVGGRHSSGFGAELEGFYHALNPDLIGLDFDPGTEEFFVGDGSLFGGMVNVTYTFTPPQSRWRPRIGGGVGYARVTFDIDNAFDDSDGALAYQGFVGLGYALTDNLEVQLNGRYLGLSNVDFDDNDFFVGAQFDTLAATIGLVWTR